MTGKPRATWPPGLKATRVRTEWFTRVGALPPGLTFARAARLLKTQEQTARKWLNAFGYVFTGHRPLPADAWDAVAWTLPDAEIGRRLGVSGQTAWNHRRARGLPRPAPAPKPKSPVLAYVEQHRMKLSGLTAAAIAAAYREATGLSASLGAVRAVMRAAGLPKGKPWRPPRMPRPNWELPSAVLAEVWGLSAVSVRIYRRRQGAGPARWTPRAAAAAQDPAFRAAVRAERAKARGSKLNQG